MKYASFLPFTALLAITGITLLVSFGVLPPGDEILQGLGDSKSDYFYLVIFLIILLESIIYVGFYFPGQFFAVILVVGANPSAKDVLYLTIAMVLAATIGSIINYSMGRLSLKKHEGKELSQWNSQKAKQTKLKHLLLAMIHINSLAFFMFAQGADNKSIRVVGLAGLLNLPYYLLLIAGTAVLSDQVMQMAENTIFLISIISIWLFIALVIDYRKYR